MAVFSFLMLLCALGVLGEPSLEDMECPIPQYPGGTSATPQEACAEYSTCEYTSGVCHMKSNSVAGYKATSSTPTSRGIKIQLEKIDPTITMFEDDFQKLTFEVINQEDYHVQIKIYPTDVSRYEVPVPLNLPDIAGSSPMYSVTTSNIGDPFTFAVVRNSNMRQLFSTVGPLTFEDQFIQIHTQLPSDYLYGFGENTHTSFRHTFSPRTTFPIFNRDHPISTEQLNEYGQHPYYMVMEDSEGNSHSVMLFTSNAMEYSTYMLNSSPALTLRVIGGILDFHFFLGPMPEDLNTQYANMVGKPIFPTYWSLGFQLSRWGYWSTDNVRTVRDRMRAAGIPQDVQTFDIDYMERYRDFTYDPVNWGDLPQLIQEFHDENIKLTLILDPAIVIDWDNYAPASRGRAADVFIKWASPSLVPSDQPSGADDYVVGYVWPDTKTVFPDFLKPGTRSWWANELSLFKQLLDFDAIWIDMNEPANFGTDTARPWNYPPELPDWSLKCPYTRWDSPPYPTKTIMVGGSESGRICEHSICMTTNQTDGTNVYLHYDVHPLYGWAESVATYSGLENISPGYRHMVLSRSTFPSSGKYAIHWLGDDSADWEQMRMSIIGIFEFNMFAMPMVGADICGFFGDTTVELCSRWMEVGSFYPFSRNHNADGYSDQDPAYDPTVASISRTVLLLRYQYIPYLYQLFHRAHMYGNSVARPLLNVFPADITARDVDDQFLWADGIMIAPVLYEGATSRNVYFPQSKWYDLSTGALIATGPTTQSIYAPLEVIPVYARGGRILPWQEPAVTTTESRQNPFGLTVALDSQGKASGDIYWDDGELQHQMQNSFMATTNFDAGELTMTVTQGASFVASLNLETVQFFGYSSNPSSVILNGGSLAQSSWNFDSTKSVLTVTFSVPLGQDLTLQIA